MKIANRRKERGKKRQVHAPSRAHTMHQVFFLPACQVNSSLKSGGSMSARRELGKKRPRPIDELCSRTSDSGRTADATSARWHETLTTRVASLRWTRRYGSSGLFKNEVSTKGAESFEWRPDARKRNLPLPSFRVRRRGSSPLFRLVGSNLQKYRSPSRDRHGANALASPAQETSRE